MQLALAVVQLEVDFMIQWMHKVNFSDKSFCFFHKHQMFFEVEKLLFSIQGLGNKIISKF